MIWGEAELVAELSRWQALQPGDLIFTGTPAGVGAVGVGARLVGQVDGLEPVVVTIGDARRGLSFPRQCSASCMLNRRKMTDV
jgi:fumarylpyruvate hydrolase